MTGMLSVSHRRKRDGGGQNNSDVHNPSSQPLLLHASDSQNMIDIMSIFDTIWATASPVRLQSGACLFRAGNQVRSMFRVTSGTIRLERVLPQGTSLTLQLATAGFIVAEASLFAARYHCDALAEGEAIVVKLPKASVLAQFSDPTCARLLLQNLAYEVQQTRIHAEILALRTVAERLDAWLDVNGSGLPQKGTWRRLAAELAVSPEALYREIAKRQISRHGP
jgi:CRP-like cAMP-binding protein